MAGGFYPTPIDGDLKSHLYDLDIFTWVNNGDLCWVKPDSSLTKEGQLCGFSFTNSRATAGALSVNGNTLSVNGVSEAYNGAVGVVIGAIDAKTGLIPVVKGFTGLRLSKITPAMTPAVAAFLNLAYNISIMNDQAAV